MPISDAFPFESKFIEVHGAQMHYIEEGEGDPILFLHGNPTNCYLWRNVIPHLSQQGRCIAVDLIGMGKSEKLGLDYNFFDHSKYLEGFIEEMGLENITLVLHDWGGGLGSYYAIRHQDNIKAMALMETIVKPASWSDWPKGARLPFKLFRMPYVGYVLNQVLNVFVRQLIPMSVMRKLTQVEMKYYLEPFPTIASRKPAKRWPQQIPIDGEPADVHKAIEQVYSTMQKWNVPKLYLYAKPGAIMNKDFLDRHIKDKIPNSQFKSIGKGSHYIQEDQPDAIGQAVSEFLKSVSTKA